MKNHVVLALFFSHSIHTYPFNQTRFFTEVKKWIQKGTANTYSMFR